MFSLGRRQSALDAELCVTLGDALAQLRAEAPRRVVDGGGGLDAVVAAELAHAVVVEDGGVGRHVEHALAGHVLPHKVVSRLHHLLRLADVLGALLVRMQFGASPRLALRHQPRVGHLGVVRPLQVEKAVLERERAGRARSWPRQPRQQRRQRVVPTRDQVLVQIDERQVRVPAHKRLPVRFSFSNNFFFQNK